MDTLGQRRTIRTNRGEMIMLFTELMHSIHPHLMKDADVPSFTRNIIQMLCDIPEEDWYTKKDPSSEERYKDESLRKFYNRGLTKKLAKSMLGRLTKDNFLDAINDPDRSDIVLEGLANDVQPLCDTEDVDVSNVADILFELFHKSLEYTVNPELENDRKIRQAENRSNKAKGTYGSGLVDDCKYTCSMSNCGKHLQTIGVQNQSIADYEILLIDELKGIKYENLIAVCHDCFQKYALSHAKSEEKNLKAIKKLQIDSRTTRQTLDDIAINKGIELVIENLSKAKPTDFKELTYDPVSIAEKIDENKNYFLVNDIRSNVARYYQYIENTMKNLAMKNVYSDDLIRAQIKESYLQLANKKLSPEQIFNELAERIRRITKQDIRFCYIVVSYFVQSCEVFHAITK